MHDADGIPPGLDRELTGKEGYIKFEGVFYPMPERGPVSFYRPVTIIWASAEVYLAQDRKNKTLYVVDREKKLSLGCRMKATLVGVANPLPVKVYEGPVVHALNT